MQPSGRSACRASLLLAVLVACGRGEEPAPPAVAGRSPNPRTDIVEALRADRLSERHRSDGSGRVRFDGDPRPAVAGRTGRWDFIFEAGAEGIAEGGWLFFQAPPFWGWSTPQVVAPEAPGFTTVETDAPGVSLQPITVDVQLLAIQVLGRHLEAGERIRVGFGTGAAGAVADRYAESRSCFFFAVDGDGDGVRALVGDGLCVEVVAGPAARLVLVLPSTARRGEPVTLRAALVDAVGNRVADWSGDIVLRGAPELSLPEAVEVRRQDEGAAAVELLATAVGVFRVRGATADGLAADSNPMVVGEDPRRLLWADLHGHSALSDGSGTPRDYLRYARDVAGLDVVALTDHDHWGMQPLATHPQLWEESRREIELHHEPDRFVTLLGYEWTSWIHGHRHVLYFSDRGEIFSSLDERFESPTLLWEALRGEQALTFAHHSAGGPIATDWRVPPDPVLEPVTEIVSVHGSSEAPDSPGRIYEPVAGNFVRDALGRGYVLGFVGSGDSHDGHPGLAQLAASSGGLAAIVSQDLTRPAILEALRSRRVYATNGPRIVLWAEIAERPLGAVIDPNWLRTHHPAVPLRVEVNAPAEIDRVDVVSSAGEVVAVDCGRAPRCRFDHPLPEMAEGDFLYVRVVQVDGGAAWSSPFYFRRSSESE